MNPLEPLHLFHPYILAVEIRGIRSGVAHSDQIPWAHLPPRLADVDPALTPELRTLNFLLVALSIAATREGEGYLTGGDTTKWSLRFLAQAVSSCPGSSGLSLP